MGEYIKIDEVEVGMVADQDVKNPQGAVLLKKGIELTERHLKIFKTWGVKTVCIKDDSAETARPDGVSKDEFVDLKIAELKKEMDEKFLPHEGNEPMQVIKQSVFRYRSQLVTKTCA